jgi:hypothetical protein
MMATNTNGPTEWTKAPRIAGAYIAGAAASRDENGERYELEPETILRPYEIRDLRVFFCEGVSSTFGAQLDQALSRRISDDAMHDARMMKALLTRLRKGWKPTKAKRAKRSKKSRVTRRSPITEVFLKHVGISVGMVEKVAPEIVDAGGLMTERDAYMKGLDVADLSDQEIYMHAGHGWVSPRVPSDIEIKRARTMWDVACRLRLIAEDRRDTLQDAYGLPSGEWPQPMCEEDYVAKHGDADGFRFNSQRATALKKFGHLLEIVVRAIRDERKPSDPLATRTILGRINDDAFVRARRHHATNLLREAARAYAETR